MKSNNFAICIQNFLTKYLVEIRGVSSRTLESYRETISLFISYMMHIKGIRPNNLDLRTFTAANVNDFLKWMEEDRKVGISTRNQRKSALSSLAKYIIGEYPDYINNCIQINNIPSKKYSQAKISYLTEEGINLFFSVIDTKKIDGLKKYVMMTILCACGLRVSELINLTVSDLTLNVASPYINVYGKGRKRRIVPIPPKLLDLIKKYLAVFKLDLLHSANEILFKNQYKTCYTRQGINKIVKKYRELAREKDPLLMPKDLSPHKLRHSFAMMCMSKGVDIVYVRDLLGHNSVRTTEIYAKLANTEKKKDVITELINSIPSINSDIEKKHKADDLEKWLEAYCGN